jgi:hypothetical protein
MLRAALVRPPGVRSFVIDTELVACNDNGLPNFYRLDFHRYDRGLCVWAFDLFCTSTGAIFASSRLRRTERKTGQPTGQNEAARFRGGFLSEVIGRGPRGLRTQWCL